MKMKLEDAGLQIFVPLSLIGICTVFGEASWYCRGNILGIIYFTGFIFTTIGTIAYIVQAWRQ